MLTKEENEMLTRVGSGAPAGNLLRRYWHPVTPASELTEERPKKRIKILGEELVLFRNEDGSFGLLGEHCSHRGTSLYYGFLENGGLRCPYHGWLYDRTGKCLEQPFEPNSRFRESVHHAAYPVQSLAGLLFAYMGPEPTPLLPRWDLLVREDGTRSISVHPILNCNWLQAQENSVDPTHTYYLHAYTMQSKGIRQGSYHNRKIEKIDFEPFEFGIVKKRTYAGERPELGHPMVFPNMLRTYKSMHFRVPIDDTHTQIFVVDFHPAEDGKTKPSGEGPSVEYVTTKDEKGEFHRETFNSQDEMAWETQGPVFDRTRENLGQSDRGITLFRKILREQIRIVQQGGEPMALVRDPEKNKIIQFISEEEKWVYDAESR